MIGCTSCSEFRSWPITESIIFSVHWLVLCALVCLSALQHPATWGRFVSDSAVHLLDLMADEPAQFVFQLTEHDRFVQYPCGAPLERLLDNWPRAVSCQEDTHDTGLLCL